MTQQNFKVGLERIKLNSSNLIASHSKAVKYV